MGNPTATQVIDLPELLLLAAVVVISPSLLEMFLGGVRFYGTDLFLSFLLSVVFSIAYLHARPTGSSRESDFSLHLETIERRFVIFRKYDFVLLAYGLVFAFSFAILWLPYAVWWAFLPFHSVMVLLLTITGRNIQPSSRYLIRVSLAVLFCLGGIAWPFGLTQHFGFT